VSAARGVVWAGIEARHDAPPGVRIADKVLDGVTCIRLDASVVTCHSDKELAEPNFKGFGYHPLLAYCDNAGEPLAGMLRRGLAGSNTAADHLTVLEAAIAALPPAFRRKLMVTCDGAGASHALITRLDELASRRGYQVTWSAGWELAGRERRAIALAPGAAWQGPAGDQLATWPAAMRVFARRERPHPGAQLTLFEAEDGWRYSRGSPTCRSRCRAGARTPPTSTPPTGSMPGSRTASEPDLLLRPVEVGS
jgi:hypothetical protein